MMEQIPDPSDETREQVARVAAFVRRALRFWRASLAVLALGGIACAIFLYVHKPTYRSETVILYSERVRPGDDSERPDSARSVTVRLKELLLSRTSLESVVRELDLYPEIRKTRGAVDATEELKKHLEFRAPGGDTFSLAFTGETPTQAQAVTARLAEVVIGQDADLRRKQAIAMRDFLETEKRATEDGLRDAELALASFMAAHPRFALDATPLATGAAIRASMGGAAAPAPVSIPRPHVAHVSRHATEGGSAPVTSTTEPEAVPTGALLAEEARAKAGLAAAQTNLADLSSRFTAAHPDVRAAQAEVERATARLAAASAAVAAAGASGNAVARVAPAPPRAPAIAPAPFASPPPLSASTKDGAPKASVPSAQGAGGDVVTLETEWVKLTRATTEARQHEDQVEAALFKAKSAVTSETGNQAVQVTMIDPAFLPQSPVPPGRTVLVALFAAASLVLAAIAAALRALIDDRVYEERDIGLLTPVLALVPRRAHVQ